MVSCWRSLAILMKSLTSGLTITPIIYPPPFKIHFISCDTICFNCCALMGEEYCLSCVFLEFPEYFLVSCTYFFSAASGKSTHCLSSWPEKERLPQLSILAGWRKTLQLESLSPQSMHLKVSKYKCVMGQVLLKIPRGHGSQYIRDWSSTTWKGIEAKHDRTYPTPRIHNSFSSVTKNPWNA